VSLELFFVLILLAALLF